MTVLVGTIGTSVVAMPLGKEAETAVMVTVWVCTRGGCGREHSPMNPTLHTATNWRHTVHSFNRNSHFLSPTLAQEFWKQQNRRVIYLPTTNDLERHQETEKSNVGCKDDESEVKVCHGTFCGRGERARATATRRQPRGHAAVQRPR